MKERERNTRKRRHGESFPAKRFHKQEKEIKGGK